ncbi:MAG TPA: CsgG/HfaB family protein [Candidatus Angelobacter sp.]|jgi:TolB-like protein|nr:CsgG/HfaB family protein [Candidatus Angelobacter sp.]
MLIGRRLLFILFTLGAFSSAQDRGIAELASNLGAQIRTRVKGPIAVTSFLSTRGDSYCPTFSNYLVDRLNILLVNQNNEFVVVNRDQVEEVFKEINLALAKNYDASTFAKAGRHLGAKALVRGRYTTQLQGATISVATQIVDVESGRIIGGDVQDLAFSADIKTLLEPCRGTSNIEDNSPEITEIPIQSSTWIYWQQLRASVVRIRRYHGLTAVTFKIDGSSNNDPYRWVPAPMQTSMHDFYTANTDLVDQNGRRYRLLEDSPDLPEQTKYKNGNYVLAPHESIVVTYLFEPIDTPTRKLKVTFPAIIKDGNLDVGRVTIHVALQ